MKLTTDTRTKQIKYSNDPSLDISRKLIVISKIFESIMGFRYLCERLRIRKSLLTSYPCRPSSFLVRCKRDMSLFSWFLRKTKSATAIKGIVEGKALKTRVLFPAMEAVPRMPMIWLDLKEAGEFQFSPSVRQVSLVVGSGATGHYGGGLESEVNHQD